MAVGTRRFDIIMLDFRETRKKQQGNVMGFLDKKKILVTGLLSNRSIAYGIAKAMHREGAELAFTYAGEGLKERVEKLAPEFGTKIILPCDVSKDEEIEGVFTSLKSQWDGLDG